MIKKNQLLFKQNQKRKNLQFFCIRRNGILSSYSTVSTISAFILEALDLYPLTWTPSTIHTVFRREHPRHVFRRASVGHQHSSFFPRHSSHRSPSLPSSTSESPLFFFFQLSSESVKSETSSDFRLEEEVVGVERIAAGCITGSFLWFFAAFAFRYFSASFHSRSFSSCSRFFRSASSFSAASFFCFSSAATKVAIFWRPAS